MGKISPVSAKYIVNATIDIEGVVDRPDVIGAIFGQTEGLLGSDLELRELQRSGRIGRIEVNAETRGGKTKGQIIIPSSLDKAETAIVAAALEIIQRIGPCNAKIAVENIEDVRVSKRNFVVERAKELLKRMMETVMPDSQEITDEVAYSVRVMEIIEYGKDRLPAGPAIEESEEIIVVEGRADVINLLKHGIKNAIAINGTSVPETIIELCKKKDVTAFVDGDRGGDLILKELINVAELDYVTKAPAGKEVEEITKKEIHKAIRSRISFEQAKHELFGGREQEKKFIPAKAATSASTTAATTTAKTTATAVPKAKATGSATGTGTASGYKKAVASSEEKDILRDQLENLIGTRAGEVLNDKFAVISKFPISELATALKDKNEVYAVVFDGVVDKDIAKVAEKSNVKFFVAMDSKIRPNETRVTILTSADL